MAIRRCAGLLGAFIPWLGQQKMKYCTDEPECVDMSTSCTIRGAPLFFKFLLQE